MRDLFIPGKTPDISGEQIMSKEYQDPNLKADGVHISSYATVKDSGFVIEMREFNRFQDDEVPSQAKHRTEKHTMALPTEHEEGGKCWTEQQFEFFNYLTRYFIKKRWVEYWRVDEALTNYYETIHEFVQNAKDVAKTVPDALKNLGKAGGLKTGTTDGALTAAGAAGLVVNAAKALAPLAEGTIPAATGTLEAGAITAAPAVAAIGKAAATGVQVAVPAAIGSATFVAVFDITTQVMEVLDESAEFISAGWEFVNYYYGPEELELTGTSVDHIHHPCEKKEEKRFMIPPYGIWFMGGLIVLIALILAFLGGVFNPRPQPTAQPLSQPPISAPLQSPSPTPKVEFTALPTTVPLGSAFGIWDITLVVLSDPSGHKQYVLMPATLELNATVGSINFTGPAPWVNVSGPLNADGSFDAIGTGLVAGRPGIGVEFKGQITPTTLMGNLSMGVAVVVTAGSSPVTGGLLPTGLPIIFQVQGQRPAAGAATSIPSAALSINDPRLTTFMAGFVPALRANDTTFLFQHLDPAVLNLYGATQCQSHMNQRIVDPTYNVVILDVQGPVAWEWVASGVTTLVQNVYTLDANVTVQGVPKKEQIHFSMVGDTFDWFTVCGNPLVTPTP
jgi:hypothetical protein